MSETTGSTCCGRCADLRDWCAAEMRGLMLPEELTPEPAWSAALVDALTAIKGTDELCAHLAAEELHAPTLLDFEIVSTLRGLTLGGHLSVARAADLLTDFEDLPVQRWPFVDGLRRRAVQLRDNVSAYDAAYGRGCGRRVRRS